MPIPESPQTRQEQYLDAMATGNTSGLPDTPQTREEMYLDTIARNGGGGSGSGLPEVSAEDNGDILTVVEGAWAKAAPSGGGGVLVVNADLQTGTLDKTWQEMYDSAVPMFVLKASESSTARWWYPVVQAAYDQEDGYWIGVLNDTNTVDYYVCNAATDYPVLEED